jgi:signal transduction histidine kinase
VIRIFAKESKLIIIFILTVIVSGSILTYLSITHISNYKELLEKKISEEEHDVTKRFSLDFQHKLEALTTKFSHYTQESDLNSQDLRGFDTLKGLLNYVVLDSTGIFKIPYFVNDKPLLTNLKPSNFYLDRLHLAENNEFVARDFKNAESFYLQTLKVAITASDSAHTYNSMGRLYVKMNLPQKAFDSYQIILTKFSNTTNYDGFPYAYFSIIKLLKISNTSNIKQLQKLLLSFLNGLDKGTIPLNDSTIELLNSILAWQQEFPEAPNNLFKDLIERNKNTLLLINTYKIPIEKILKEKKDELTENQTGNYLSIKPTSSNKDELMLFYPHQSNSFGFVIGLSPLFWEIIRNQQTNHLKFEYEIKLVEKKENNFLLNTNLMTRTEFTPLFENRLIQVSLKNKNIINEAVFRRKITYGIGLFLFLGTMVLGLYLLIQDVNREKRINKLRADFVSNVTHELKTPLTSIHMFAEALHMEKNKLDARQKKYTHIIVKESEKLKRTINNILEFSKKENNKLTFKLEKLNLTNIVNETLKEMDYFLEINKMDVHLNIEKNLYANVYAEGIKQALSNLISNAIKYSSSNKKLNIHLYKTVSEIFIEVEDFGIGIPKDKLEHIFEKFYRINSNKNETASGTGLGLTVTKDIIEEQHGKLLVESTWGKGSKFTIILNNK